MFSATAFHWIPEEVGYPKVYDLLKPGGVFARFANHPFPGEIGTPLYDTIQDIYQTFRGASYQPLKKYTVQDAEALSSIASKYGFCDITAYTYNRTRTFTAKEYISLLGTYSDNIAMSDTDRSRFFSEIERAINLHDGTITIFDTLDLNLARKPLSPCRTTTF